MISGRRVGTFTVGTSLILFGVLYLVKTFFVNISYHFIVSLWPVILILLGLEVIVAYVINKNEKMKYDVAGVALLALLMFFAMGMAFSQFIIEHPHGVVCN